LENLPTLEGDHDLYTVFTKGSSSLNLNNQFIQITAIFHQTFK
jgi:hypothetical protein